MRHLTGIGNGAGINNYVPGMQYTAGVEVGGIVEVSLGSPLGLDADGIHADIDTDVAIVAATATLYAVDFVPGTGGLGAITDATYGQNVTMTPSADPGATLFVYDIYGEDYLGQPMVERFTSVNGSTAAIVGVKAFKRITKIVHITASSNDTDTDIGWGAKLGVPYKMGQLIGAVENGVFVKPQGLIIGDTDSFAAANATTSTHVSPIDGYFIGMQGRITTAMTGAPSVVTAALAGADYNAGDWVSPIGVAGVALGFELDKADWGAVTRGQSIIWTSDGAGTGGVDEISAMWSYGLGDFLAPVITDPATKTTGDPRGLYDPQIAPDGTKEFVLQYLPDASVNAAGNGGLHGIQHYIA